MHLRDHKMRIVTTSWSSWRSAYLHIVHGLTYKNMIHTTNKGYCYYLDMTYHNQRTAKKSKVQTKDMAYNPDSCFYILPLVTFIRRLDNSDSAQNSSVSAVQNILQKRTEAEYYIWLKCRIIRVGIRIILF